MLENALATIVQRHLQLKQHRRGLDETSNVESFLALNAGGGECLDDFDVLREDAGTTAMPGYEPPAAAGKFLRQFHGREKIGQAQPQRLNLQRASILPAESEVLAGLAALNRDGVGKLGRRRADQKIAAVDLEATIIASHKRQARPADQGATGYLPLLALWAEMDAVLADPVRDGNTPAILEPLAVARRALGAPPGTVAEYHFRGGAACSETDLLGWLRDENRQKGPQCFIGFAVSAPMVAPLKAEMAQRDQSAWQVYRQDAEAVLEGPAVPCYPQETRAPVPPAVALRGDSRAPEAKANCLPAAPRSSIAPQRRICGTGSRNVGWSGIARSRVRSRRPATCSRTSWRRACCPADGSARTRPGAGSAR